MKKEKKISKRQTIRDDIDSVIKLISEGISYDNIAKRYNITQSELCYILHETPEYSIRTREALRIASYDLIDQAQKAIEEIDDNATHSKVARQRELKNILLYRAQIKNRSELDFSYKQPVDLTLNNNTPTINLILNKKDNQ